RHGWSAAASGRVRQDRDHPDDGALVCGTTRTAPVAAGPGATDPDCLGTCAPRADATRPRLGDGVRRHHVRDDVLGRSATDAVVLPGVAGDLAAAGVEHGLVVAVDGGALRPAAGVATVHPRGRAGVPRLLGDGGHGDRGLESARRIPAGPDPHLPQPRVRPAPPWLSGDNVTQRHRFWVTYRGGVDRGTPETGRVHPRALDGLCVLRGW